MHKVKLSFLSVLGCIVLAGACCILALIAANPINQVMTYSTFLGGKFDDYSRDIAVDTNGYVYVVGETRSTNFPTTAGSINSKSYDVFVAKFDPSLAGESGLIWSVVIGGSGFEKGVGIALDGEGNVYVVGSTSSSDFPSTDETFLVGNKSIFLVRLDNDGLWQNGNGFATIIGQGGGTGPGYKDNVDIVVDSLDYIYLTGNTGEPGFFTIHGVPLNMFNGGSTDAFVAKFAQAEDFSTDPPLNLIYGTFIGGSGSEHAYGIAVDGSGNSYIAGGTDSFDFPTFNGLQSTLTGTYDAFVVKLDATGLIKYSTYLGGNEGTGGGSEEIGLDIAVDTSGIAYVAGRTSADDFPIKDAFDSTHNGGNDVFFVVLNPILSGNGSLIYSTYLGGGSGERGVSLAVDASGNAYVFGRTLSNDFPTTPDAFDTTFNGKHDDFLAKLNPVLSGEASLVSSTFWGGIREDAPGAIALHPDVVGDIYAYLSGSTGSRRDFPITSGAYDESYNAGQTDAFLSVLAFQEVNETPVVTINSPADGSDFGSGATIDFAGTASDFEDDDLTASLEWTSDKDGWIGNSGSFSTILSDGVHTITASVTDSDGSTGSDSISITVGTPPEPDIVGVEFIRYSTTGGKNRDKHLVIKCYLDKPVEGASVSIELERNGNKVDSFTGLTDSQGIVKFSHKNATSGDYTSVVIDVTAAGYTWDGNTPGNNYIK